MGKYWRKFYRKFKARAVCLIVVHCMCKFFNGCVLYMQEKIKINFIWQFSSAYLGESVNNQKTGIVN